ncbi:Hypothetical_protein [Hexamita inflata]|uniref:Hypothetical_protein n=1 Tax=Hexamita inflata TaxID=28002 RepID=A0AA86PWX5_9EUKA|nr:Hypothetical protein HINF_LOCUS32858 [Hexamita inflata]
MPSKSKNFFQSIFKKLDKFTEEYIQFRQNAPKLESHLHQESQIQLVMEDSNMSREEVIQLLNGLEQEVYWFLEFIFSGKRNANNTNQTEKIDTTKEQPQLTENTQLKLKPNANDQEESSSIVIEDSSPSISIDIEDS